MQEQTMPPKMVPYAEAASGFEGKSSFYYAKAMIESALDKLSPEERAKVYQDKSSALTSIAVMGHAEKIDANFVNKLILDGVELRGQALVPKDIYTKSAKQNGSFEFTLNRSLEELAISAGRASAVPRR